MTTTDSSSVGVTARPMTRRQRVVDAATTRAFGLPPVRGDYEVTSSIPVLARDGARLLTEHFAPQGRALGTVLMRSPYQRIGVMSQVLAGLFAARGYHVVLQSCRGTFGSDGDYTPGMAEIDDGADMLTWLRQQDWYEGRLAAVGGSALSLTWLGLVAAAVIGLSAGSRVLARAAGGGLGGLAALGGAAAVAPLLWTVALGDVQAFMHYCRQFTQPIVQTANIANILQSTIASAERVFEILDEPEELPDTPDASGYGSLHAAPGSDGRQNAARRSPARATASRLPGSPKLLRMRDTSSTSPSSAPKAPR